MRRRLYKKGIVERIYRFREQAPSLKKQELESQLDDIDDIRTEVALDAEKKCRKLCTGKVPYAPKELQAFGCKIRFWSLLIQRQGGGRVSRKLIRQQAKSLQISEYHKLSQEAIKRMWASAWSKYKTAKANADEYRHNFLEKRALKHEENGDLDIT